MGFGEAIRTGFAKYFICSGRASRSEFWNYILFLSVALVPIQWAMQVAVTAAITLSSYEPKLVTTAAGVLLVSPSFSAMVRRLHDTGRSGFWALPFYAILVWRPDPDVSPAWFPSDWYLWMPLAAIALLLTVLIFLLLPSNEGDNKYGPNPLSAGKETKLEPSSRAMPSPTNLSTDAQISSQALPSTSSNKQQSPPVPEPDTPDYPNARIAIEYMGEVGDAWARITTLPDLYRNQFLQALEADPKKDQASLLILTKELHSSYEKVLNPYDDDNANEALAKAREISEDAENEFRKVYAVVGEGANADDILKKIMQKISQTDEVRAQHALANQGVEGRGQMPPSDMDTSYIGNTSSPTSKLRLWLAAILMAAVAAFAAFMDTQN